MTFYDIVGFVGVAAIVAAYFLLQTDRLKSSDGSYSILNAIGAILVLFSLYHDFNFPSFIVEFFWLLISLFGIGKFYLSHRKDGTGNEEIEK